MKKKIVFKNKFLPEIETKVFYSEPRVIIEKIEKFFPQVDIILSQDLEFYGSDLSLYLNKDKTCSFCYASGQAVHCDQTGTYEIKNDILSLHFTSNFDCYTGKQEQIDEKKNLKILAFFKGRYEFNHYSQTICKYRVIFDRSLIYDRQINQNMFII